MSYIEKVPFKCEFLDLLFTEMFLEQSSRICMNLTKLFNLIACLCKIKICFFQNALLKSHEQDETETLHTGSEVILLYLAGLSV